MARYKEKINIFQMFIRKSIISLEVSIFLCVGFFDKILTPFLHFWSYRSKRKILRSLLKPKTIVIKITSECMWTCWKWRMKWSFIWQMGTSLRGVSLALTTRLCLPKLSIRLTRRKMCSQTSFCFWEAKFWTQRAWSMQWMDANLSRNCIRKWQRRREKSRKNSTKWPLERQPSNRSSNPKIPSRETFWIISTRLTSWTSIWRSSRDWLISLQFIMAKRW